VTWAHAGIVIDQSFSTQLPSQQGWTYHGGGAAPNETDRMAISNGTLSYSTVGDTASTFASYNISPVAWEQDFSLSIRLKVTQSEQTYPDPSTGLLNPFGCHFGVYNGEQGYIDLGVATDYVACITTHSEYQSASLGGQMDNSTDFHTYRVDGTFGTGGGWSIWRDEVPLGTGEWAHNYLYNSTYLVVFGDSSTGANATAQISNFSLHSPIPEPATVGLLALGWLAMIRRQRNR
jgi:hypothetical protein